MSKMSAISIRQPYVEMILRGTKKYEYRSIPTRKRERVYLYAAMTPGDAADWTRVGVEPGELPTGAIVGTVDIVDCKFLKRYGCYGYQLRHPKRLRKPIKPRKQPQPIFFNPF